MDAMQPDALLTSGSAMPDQQQLYQQHLAHWQAAFGEYWKCCASQGAALPQQWQAMMASGFGGMQYYGGNFMNPYSSMMGAAGQLNNGMQPAAGMAGVAHVAAADCVHGIAAPQPPCDDVMAFSQAVNCSGTAACAGTAEGLQPVPHVSAPLATTATSSQAGVSKTLHIQDSDADSPSTSDTLQDLPSTSMPMALQSPVTALHAASPTSASAAGQLPDITVVPDPSCTGPVAPTDTVITTLPSSVAMPGPVDASLLHASMACAADAPEFAVAVKDEGGVAPDADGVAAAFASCDTSFEDVAVGTAGGAVMFTQPGFGDATMSDLPPAAAAAAASAAPCVLPSHPAVIPAPQAPATASLTVAAADLGKAEAVGAFSPARGAGSSPLVLSLMQHQHQQLTMSLPLLTSHQQPAVPGACPLDPAAGACSTGGGSLGGSMGSGLSLQHVGSSGLAIGSDEGQGLEDRDLKRLRRKQSNRESARRSRLRKQAENDTLQQRLQDCEAQRNTLLAENAALKQRSDQLMVIMAKLSQDKIALLALVRKLGGTVPLELEASHVPISTAFTTTPEALQQHLAAVSVAAAAATQGAVAAPAAAIAVQPPAAAITVAALPEQLQQQVQQQLAHQAQQHFVQQAQQLAQVAQVQHLQTFAASQRVMAVPQPVGSTGQPAIAAASPVAALQPPGAQLGASGAQIVSPA